MSLLLSAMQKYPRLLIPSPRSLYVLMEVLGLAQLCLPLPLGQVAASVRFASWGNDTHYSLVVLMPGNLSTGSFLFPVPMVPREGDSSVSILVI